MATYEDLLKSIKSKDIKGTYIFYGEEPFFIDFLADKLIENAIEESERSFCQQIFYGRDTNVAMLGDLCRTVPMSFSANPRQLIVVKEAQDCGKKLDLLYKYLENPVESTILLLVFKGIKELDKKMPIKKVTAFKSVPFKENDKEKSLDKWINSEFKAEGYTVQPEAIRTIVEYSGTNLERIHNEIQKLIITKSVDKPITSSDIQESFGIMKDYSIFDFTASFGEKNHKNIFKIIEYYSADEKKLVFENIVGNLFTFFKTIYQIKLGQRLNMTDTAIGQELGLTQYQMWTLNKQIGYARNYSIVQIENALTVLSEYDMRKKGMLGSGLDYKGGLTELSLRILQN